MRIWRGVGMMTWCGHGRVQINVSLVCVVKHGGVYTWACWCVHRVRRVHMDMPVPLPIHTRSCSCYLLAPPGREPYSFPAWPLSSLSCLCPESLFCPTPFSHHSSSPIFLFSLAQVKHSKLEPTINISTEWNGFPDSLKSGERRS